MLPSNNNQILKKMAEAIIISDDEIEFKEKANTIPFNKLDDRIIYYAKKTKRDNVVGIWQPCRLLDKVEIIGNNNDHVVQFRDGTKKDVASYELAIGKVPFPSELEKGTRVIAPRCSEELPYKLDESGQRIGLYIDSGNSAELYPGILAGYSDNDRYMVFFDDGMVQHVERKKIRRVLGNDGYQHAHWNAQSYFEFLLTKNQWEVDLKSDPNKTLQVELNGSYEAAKVEKVDESLALIHFEKTGRFEWIYLGSPRIKNIYRKHILMKSFDDKIQFKTYHTCLSANDDIAVIDLLEPDVDMEQEQELAMDNLTDFDANAKQLVKHDCDSECVRLNECDVNVESYTALQRPMMVGWSRSGEKTKYYQAPCRVKLRSYNEIDKYLAKTNSKLRIDCFELSKNVPLPFNPKEVNNANANANDISRGVERIPIAVRNKQISLDFKYITGYNFDYIDIEPRNSLGRRGCNCEDNCRNKQKCSCWRLTVQMAMREIPEEYEYKRKANVGYKHMKLQEMIPSGIVECSSNCKCCTDKCVNHVVQNGIQHKLEVFMTEHKGWGVRTTTELPEGAFVCQYIGDVLEESAADLRDSKYQFRLPKIKINTENNGNADDADDSDGEPEAKIPRTELHDVLQPFLNYFPPFENGNADNLPDSEYIESNEDMIDFVIDALKNGNIARFINHSCDPNLFIQKVYASDDKRFPLIAFFAHKSIKANEEITIDYGYEQNDDKKLECFCGAANCRKRLV